MIKRPLIHVLAIFFIISLIYSNTLKAPFIFDDSINIVNNPAIKDTSFFSDISNIYRIDNYHKQNKPLLKTRYIGYLSFALNYRLHGLDVMGYHIVNILIHILNSLILYWFFTLTLRTPFFSFAGKHLPFSSGSFNFIAFFPALLFAVHPLQTQAVTYIVQRFASLATFFYLFSLVMYIKWKSIKEKRTKSSSLCVMLYAVSLISAVLAMKTKEFAFTLPAVITTYELMFFGGKITKRLLYLSPFFLATLIIPLSLADTVGSLGALSGIYEEAVNVSGALDSISRKEYMFTQSRVIMTYIRLLFFPLNQNIDYDYPVFKSFLVPSVVLSFIFILLVMTAGIYMYRLSKNRETKDSFWFRLISFGIFWFFVSLSAESGVIPINDVIFEHRIYLPSVSFFITLTASIMIGLTRCKTGNVYARKAVVYFMIPLILLLSGATYARNALWKDSVKFWENTVKKSPDKARSHNNLGVEYADKNRFVEAINEYQIALGLNPDYADAHNNLGLAYANKGRIDEAAYEFETAIKLKPFFADAHNNLAVAFGSQGRIDEAINELKIALTLNPDDANAYYNIGVAFGSQGRIDEAINKYQIALKLKPDFAEAHNNLGLAYANKGRIDEAIIEYQTAIKLKPGFTLPRQNLDLLLKKPR